jgi:hypothetical protein
VVDRATLTALYLDEVRRRGLRAGDLLGDLPGLKPFYYRGRFLSRPVFIGYRESRQLYADVENMQDALLSLPDVLFGGDFAAFARAAGAYGAAAAVMASQTARTRLARADLYATGDGFRLLELNHGSAIGGQDNAFMGRALLRHPVLAEFARTHGLTCVDTLSHQIGTVFAETGVDPRSGPVVAVTDWAVQSAVTSDPHLDAIAADWRSLGVDAHPCYLGDLSCRGGRVWLDGRRVDVIYRLFTIAHLMQSPGGAAVLTPVLDAAARGEVALCTSVDSEIFSSKAALAMISDDTNQHLFTAAQRESIARIVPWTRLVRPGPVTTPDGSRADLLDYAVAHQDELILKPSTGTEGTGVIPGWKDLSPQQWRAHVTSASDPWYVLQERVRPESELFPDESGALIPWNPVYGLFTGTPGYGGVYIRAAMAREADVINRALGAFCGSCLSASPAGAA